MDDNFFRAAQQGTAPDLLPGAHGDAHAAQKYRQVTAKQQVDLNVKLICQFCRDPVPNLIEDFKQGDLICGNCGTVFKDRIIDTRSEWRTFSSDEGGDDPSRVGGAENRLLGPKLNLETSIGGGLHADKRELAKTHAKTSVVRSEKILLEGFRTITAMGERMGLNRKIIEAAKQYFKMAETGQPIKKIEATVAVALLLGCRKCGADRSLQEFASMINISKTEFGKVLSQVKNTLRQASQQQQQASSATAVAPTAGDDHDANPTTNNAGALARRFCNALSLPMPMVNSVVAVCDRAYTITEMASRNPRTIAGAAIYLVTHLYGQPVAAKTVASMVKVTENTVRQAYRIVRGNLEAALPEDLLKMDTSRLPAN
ncbi:hypothetical protein AMAG_09291 [Allomyces macrogynus ATCC 38327]|uniref:General transcription factor TFIIB n=1 Tax=Allomyces macrogynus (strain ATCC 38327) TaxID=578462 RepID=A0A0L0SP38_ALLM3|nr:hypothetical protein AMAG_09291 [Allomyces macrogynus ATCC 38327]|eukprot:KNE64257.1 hypothetical protein AMAG_09291 [Allomyces macrogynus ATCC 38327]